MFAKITNGQIESYPYSVGQLRRDYPNTSFPKTIPETTMNIYGMHKVVFDVDPEVDPLTQKVVVAESPTLKDGSWTIVKLVVDLTVDEIEAKIAAKASQVRSIRDRLLADTDWTQVADAPVDVTVWATYRQALRDITDHVNFPYLTEADWPTL